jgi:ureidoglycolate hydrolase
MQSSEPARPTKTIELMLRPLDANTFSPFGQVISTGADGKPFGADDAQLEFRGTPRFYILPLKRREPRFRQITRHLKVTQCLASVGAKPWFLAVAPPDDPDNAEAMPDPSSIAAFWVPGNVAVKLHRSSWHAGPFFSEPTLEFFNLELSDTNKTDHFSCQLDRQFGLEFAFAGFPSEVHEQVQRT